MARTNNRRVKSLLHQSLYFTAVSSLHKKNYEDAIEKSSWQYFKDVLHLVYSFLLVSFFVNVSGASSFNDDRTSAILQHVRFRNCFVCLSLMTPWKAMFLSCLIFIAKQKSRLFAALFETKSTPNICSQEKPDTG